MTRNLLFFVKFWRYCIVFAFLKLILDANGVGGEGKEEDSNLFVQHLLLWSACHCLLERLLSNLTWRRTLLSLTAIVGLKKKIFFFGLVTEKYERDAKKYWDVFYRRHQDKVWYNCKCNYTAQKTMLAVSYLNKELLMHKIWLLFWYKFLHWNFKLILIYQGIAWSGLGLFYYLLGDYFSLWWLTNYFFNFYSSLRTDTT